MYARDATCVVLRVVPCAFEFACRIDALVPRAAEDNLCQLRLLNLGLRVLAALGAPLDPQTALLAHSVTTGYETHERYFRLHAHRACELGTVLHQRRLEAALQSSGVHSC